MSDDNLDLAHEGPPLETRKAMAAWLAAVNGPAEQTDHLPGIDSLSTRASDLDLANAAVTRARQEEEAAKDIPSEIFAGAGEHVSPLDPAADGKSPKGRGRKRDKHKQAVCAARPEKSDTVRYDIAILERPVDERPRERLEKMGASALSVTELLAIQLRTGSLEQSALGLAGELLHAFGGLRGVAAASREELCRVKGIGPVKAVEICAAIEMSRRLSVLSADEKPCIRSPQDVSNLLMAEMRDLKKEHLRSLLLDSRNS